MSCHLIKECCTRDGSRSTEVAVQAEASNHLALGRRIEKRYKKTITKWLWDGNKPLHEWKEFDFKENNTDDLITWIFEEDSFAPAAKIKGDKKYALVCDHLGTPTQGYNEEGALIWERQLDSYGKVKMLQGDEGFCNYLYQGQTLDAETGLAYNRFRYYDAEEGVYISQDPIGLEGGRQLYGYIKDPSIWIDAFGLSGTKPHGHHSDPKFMGGDPKQKLTPLSPTDHVQLHRDLNEHLSTKIDPESGKSMRPARGNSGREIQDRFSLQDRRAAMAEFYSQNKKKYPGAAADFFTQHPHLQPKGCP